MAAFFKWAILGYITGIVVLILIKRGKLLMRDGEKKGCGTHILQLDVGASHCVRLLDKGRGCYWPGLP